MNTIELCEIGLIKVNAIKGKNIFEIAKECSELSKYLKVVVTLYYNDKIVDVFVDTKIEDIINKCVSP